jgi:hypothetical protein
LLTESIVKYAERVTAAESKVSELESRLSNLEMGNQPYAAEAAYFTPQAPTFHYPAPPATIRVPPPQQPWGVDPPQPQQPQGGTGSQQHRRKKRRNNGNGYGGRGGGSPFGVSPNISHHQPMGRGPQYSNQQHYGQPPHNYGNTMGYVQPQQRPGYNHGHSQSRQGQPGGRGNGLPYSNAIKQNMNLCYCFSCGYDVDHPGFQCPNPRSNHIPTVKREDAHTIWGASMKAQHKTLPDGTGAGMGWILAQNLRKANFVMDKRQENYEHWRRQQGPT